MTDTNNGWPGEPGVPLNPERDGWHWCERDGGLEPRFWSSGRRLWAGLRNSWISPKMLLALFGYAGPCLTPDETAALIARIAELEAALRFYDDEENWRRNGQLDPDGSNFTGGPARAALAGGKKDEATPSA